MRSLPRPYPGRAGHSPEKRGRGFSPRPYYLHQLFAKSIFASQRRQPLFQLSLSGDESVAQHHVNIFMVTAIRFFHVYDHVFARNGQLHLYVVNLAVILMPVRRIQYDAARLYAVTENAKVIREL